MLRRPGRLISWRSVFLLIERIVRPHEPAICARLGVIDAGYAPVVRGWALAVFGLAVSLAIFVVVGEMSWTMLGQGPIMLALIGIDWWAMLATLGLTGVFLMTLGSDPEGWGALEPEHLVVALHWAGRGLLVVAGSRLLAARGPLIGAGVYYPLATAVAGLATARIVRRHTHDESWHELAWLGDLRSESMGRMLSIQACVLAVLAVVFTKGAIEPATVLTLILASLTLGAGRAGDGMAGGRVGGERRLVGRMGRDGLGSGTTPGLGGRELRATCASVGVLLAAFSLLALAGWLRRDPRF